MNETNHNIEEDFSHLVIEVVERGFVLREMTKVTFRKVAYPQLIPGNEGDNK